MHKGGTSWTSNGFSPENRTCFTLNVKPFGSHGWSLGVFVVLSFPLWPPESTISWLQHLEDNIFQRCFPTETLKAEIGPFIPSIKMMNQGYSPVSLNMSSIKIAVCQSWSPMEGLKWWDKGGSFQGSGSTLSKEWKVQEVRRVAERNISQMKQQGCWERGLGAKASTLGNFRITS